MHAQHPPLTPPKLTWDNQWRVRKEKYLHRIEQARQRLEDIAQGLDPQYAEEAPRALAVLLSGQVMSVREIATQTGLTASCVQRVLHRFELYGLPGLQDPAPRHQSGRPAQTSRLPHQKPEHHYYPSQEAVAV